MTGIRIVIIGVIALFSSSVAFGQIVSVSQLACNPNSLNSGAPTTCTVTLVTLNGAAPAGGTEVLLSSNNALLLGSNSVIVPAGTNSTSFTATAGSISANQTGTLTATNPASSGDTVVDPVGSCTWTTPAANAPGLVLHKAINLQGQTVYTGRAASFPCADSTIIYNGTETGFLDTPLEVSASAAPLTGFTFFDTRSVLDSKSAIQAHAGVIR
jgi:hypothetical protein